MVSLSVSWESCVELLYPDLKHPPGCYFRKRKEEAGEEEKQCERLGLPFS